MIRGLWMGVLGVAGLAGPAFANDSVAGLALGGLQLLRTDAVTMVEEDLYISPSEVRVRYLFRNHSKAPVDTIVAFPLPAVGFAYDMDYVPVPFEDRDNYVGFTTRVDGVEIPLQVQTRALLLGVDRTERLRDLGVAVLPFQADAIERIAALPAEVLQALRDELLIDADNLPRWAVETLFWRRQTFAPGADVVVEHSYTPVRGGSAGSPVGNFDGAIDAGDPGYDWVEAARRRHCVEPEMEGEMSYRRLDGAAPGDRHFGASDVGYILTTGANWHGPIGRFRLVVEAPNPLDVVFVCLEGAVRVAGNRIEADIADFWPSHDLHALFGHLYGEGIVRDD